MDDDQESRKCPIYDIDADLDLSPDYDLDPDYDDELPPAPPQIRQVAHIATDVDSGSASSRDPLVRPESIESRGSMEMEGAVPRSLTEHTILTSTDNLSDDLESGDPIIAPPPEFSPAKRRNPIALDVFHDVVSEVKAGATKPKSALKVQLAPEGTVIDSEPRKFQRGGLKVPKHGRHQQAEEARQRRRKEMEQELEEDMADDPEFGESLNEMIREQRARRTMKHGKSRRWSKRSSCRSVSSDGSQRSERGRQGSIMDIYCGKDTATTKVEIRENIRVQKDIMANIRAQPWKMKRKLRTLRLAKAYVERYEGRLSKSRGYQEAGAKFWRKCKRVGKNFAGFFIPWEMRIKKIESHFGSVVSSYFTFTRWLVWVNILLAIITMCFIVVPEILVGLPSGTTPAKTVPENEQNKAYNLMTIIDFEGSLKYSVLFYGFYGYEETIGKGYRLPLAYFLAGLSTIALSFIIILKRMAKNSRIGRMASKDEHYVFSWRLFASWDYMIGNFETAKNKAAENVTIFRESIFEEEEKKKQNNKKILILLRIIANFLVLIVLASSSYAIYLVVQRSQKFEEDLKAGKEVSWYERNEVSIVMSLITALFPSIFDLIGLMEKFHPRINLRWQLTRILILYLLNLYTLIIALYNKISNQEGISTDNTNCTLPTLTDPGLTTTMSMAGTLSTGQQEVVFQQTLPVAATAAVQDFNSTDLLYYALLQNSTSLQNLTTAAVDSITTSLSTTTTTTSTTLLGTDVSTYVSPSGCSNETLEAQHACWETMIGQEIMKLTMFDTLIAVAVILVIDFIRGCWVRYCNGWWCWDLEKKFPEYGEFKIAENILHLIYNQATIWMGTFFSPVLPAINIFKLLILLYVRSWAVLMCNIPHERVFKASKSNNFYFALLLLMLFLVTLPVIYLLVMVRPSRYCGPLREYDKSYYIFTTTIKNELPPWVYRTLDYVASPGVILPLFLLMVMAIFYLTSLSRSYKLANKDLTMQLHYERTEEKRKIYAMADARAKGSLKAAQRAPKVSQRTASMELVESVTSPPPEVTEYTKGNVRVVRVPNLTEEQAVAIKERSPKVKIITTTEAKLRGLMPPEDAEIRPQTESSSSVQQASIPPPVAVVHANPSPERPHMMNVVMPAIRGNNDSSS